MQTTKKWTHDVRRRHWQDVGQMLQTQAMASREELAITRVTHEVEKCARCAFQGNGLRFAASATQDEPFARLYPRSGGFPPTPARTGSSSAIRRGAARSRE